MAFKPGHTVTITTRERLRIAAHRTQAGIRGAAVLRSINAGHVIVMTPEIAQAVLDGHYACERLDVTADHIGVSRDVLRKFRSQLNLPRRITRPHSVPTISLPIPSDPTP